MSRAFEYSQRWNLRKVFAIRIILCIVGFSSLLLAQDSNSNRYTTSQFEGGQIVYTDHFKFSDHSFSFNVPSNANWLPVYDENDSLVTFHLRGQDSSIEIKQIRLGTIPSDQKSALDLYVSKVSEWPSPNFIKDARVRDIDMPIGFPQTYLLATSEKDPPVKMVTFLIYSPFLYEITLEVRDKLTGALRTDYGNLLKSLTFESPSATPTSNAPANESTTASPSESGSGSSEKK
jgi:hypothetical protein